MSKKLMAAFLLVAIATWAEVTMAPMIAMYGGHMRPAHKMSADLSAEHVGHHHGAPADQAQVTTVLACCPGLHKAEPVDAPVLVSEIPACDDPHSCCFRQAPQSMPAPARDVQRLTREMAPAIPLEATVADGAARLAIHTSAQALSPPADVFGMTFRV